MTAPILTDSFTTELKDKAIHIKSDDGTVEMMFNLRSLSNKLLLGEKVDKVDMAVAGAAISHLIGMTK